jgi:ATP-dependent Clp protease protease subunit
VQPALRAEPERAVQNPTGHAEGSPLLAQVPSSFQASDRSSGRHTRRSALLRTHAEEQPDARCGDEGKDAPKKEGERPAPLGERLAEKFLDKRQIFLWGAVTDRSAQMVVERMLFLEASAPGKPIYFFINSPGGVITSGMAIYDVMRMISSPVHTICMGMAASMGAILLTVGEKKHRYVFEHAKVMIHQPLISGQIVAPALDIKIHAEEIKKTRAELNRIIADTSGQPLSRVEKDTDRDYYTHDHLLWLYISTQAKIHFFESKTTRYRKHSGGVTNSTAKLASNKKKFQYHLYDILISFDKFHSRPKKIEEKMLVFKKIMSILYRKENNLKMKAHALGLMPRYFPGVIGLFKLLFGKLEGSVIHLFNDNIITTNLEQNV